MSNADSMQLDGVGSGWEPRIQMHTLETHWHDGHQLLANYILLHHHNITYPKHTLLCANVMKCHRVSSRRATEFGLSGTVFRASFTGVCCRTGSWEFGFLKSTQDTEVITGTAMKTSKHIHCFALNFGNWKTGFGLMIVSWGSLEKMTRWNDEDKIASGLQDEPSNQIPIAQSAESASFRFEIWAQQDVLSTQPEAPHAAAAATKREGRRCTGSKCLSNTSGSQLYGVGGGKVIHHSWFDSLLIRSDQLDHSVATSKWWTGKWKV